MQKAVGRIANVVLTILLAVLGVGLGVADICSETVEDFKVAQRLAFMDIWSLASHQAGCGEKDIRPVTQHGETEVCSVAEIFVCIRNIDIDKDTLHASPSHI